MSDRRYQKKSSVLEGVGRESLIHNRNSMIAAARLRNQYEVAGLKKYEQQDKEHISFNNRGGMYDRSENTGIRNDVFKYPGMKSSDIQ